MISNEERLGIVMKNLIKYTVICGIILLILAFIPFILQDIVYYLVGVSGDIIREFFAGDGTGSHTIYRIFISVVAFIIYLAWLFGVLGFSNDEIYEREKEEKRKLKEERGY